MDEKALIQYLATGDYTPSAVPAEDMSLAEHDARWHPNGYKKGDRCLFRANLDKGDKSDADLANATPKEGGISGIFTGSAADYSKPSLLKVGTGEGTQVYGWGLYGSTECGVAEGYADNYDSDEIEYLGEQPPPKIASWAEKNLKAHHGDIDATIQELSTELFPPFKEAAQWLKDNKGSIRYTRKDTPHLYEQTFFTNRAPGDESHLLKWYGKVPKKQKAWIKAQAEKEGINISTLLWDGGEIQGAMLYHYLATPSYLGSPKAVSEFLYRAGIDGIKYPVDSYGGKTVKDGDKAGWNYVSFSDDNIRVDRKWRDGEEVDDAARTKIERYLALDASPIDPDFESKHPRGNSANKGQFRKSEKTLAKLDDADASVGSAPTPLGGGSPSAEYAAVEAKYKGTPQWMKAPNGKPTNLTEKQWVQVRTPSFKKWFGDWENDPENASKVIDSNGEPKIVYHATPEKFTAFDKDKIFSTNSATFLEGFYFSDRRPNTPWNVMEVFLNLRKPLELDIDKATFDTVGAQEIADAIHRAGSMHPDLDEYLVSNGIVEADDSGSYDDSLREWYAQHWDPDGLIVLNTQYDSHKDEFVAFEPNQIKSATSNSGSFSPDKESILDSAPASPSPEGRTAFDQSTPTPN